MKVLIQLLVSSLLFLSACAQKKQKKESNVPVKENKSIMQTEKITFGSGCFWCTEAIFQQVKGVVKVTSGYSGGHVENPTYEQVCEKNTGHAEVCQLEFDPNLVTVDELLEVFWQTHDPTTLNKQGNDEGPQYRSAVFYHNPLQQERATYFKNKLNEEGAFGNPIVTTIEPYKNFYVAENYHQDYYNRNGNQPYCYFIIKPKLEKFEKAFKSKMKSK